MKTRVTVANNWVTVTLTPIFLLEITFGARATSVKLVKGIMFGSGEVIYAAQEDGVIWSQEDDTILTKEG